MGSTTHVEEGRRELAKEVHRLASLGVQLEEDNEGGINVQNRSTSSLVFEVKEKQDRDPVLLQLKEAVHKQKVMVFSKRGRWGIEIPRKVVCT